MIRDFVSLDVGAHAHDELGVALKSSNGLLLVGMVVMSLSIISMVIFACGNDNNDKGRGGGCGGGGCGSAGGGGGGGGGGYGSGGGGGDGGGCEGGGCGGGGCRGGG
ncbi:hypothetical protein I3843_10G143200 [Carya illinoinensis]|uniref:Uncharacterized protein n=1 Tax=Carya illinoinensis TaxID=32201 RepID=A0A8T1PHX8_CARIL|nr:rRNA 2'-O-methyltransferase fibrillarin-like [Carya illinoinensis]KAG2685936.1 hypothetical protein I3760_10G150200 [Carya illinoinensis]KAG2685940.1 hypothetical protein I3760_10G150600 [Carya illinoinensis]KAG6640135.1 hypothetical protein CIPAW_10G151400 [Carya illinoinensis]KAG6640140.1 hypothetical protein CIPAW_10G151900 [Carya illinoinensis]KAG6693102.1 hypothetical protein I3842_10G148400 [Carya illinoinensis]